MIGLQPFVVKIKIYLFTGQSLYRATFMTHMTTPHYTPHFYIVKLGFTGVYLIFLIFALKHRSWVLIRTASERLTEAVLKCNHNLCFEQKNKKNITTFLLKITIFTAV